MAVNYKSILLICGIFIAAAVLPLDLAAQCPMCRATAESNMQGGGTAGAGLNAGILYMLFAPYLIVGGIAYWWWRNRRNQESDLPEELLRVDDPASMN